MKNSKVKYISQDEALAKLQRYCAYQDRCHKEVRTKLLDLGIYGEALEEIIYDLIQENFLNEERYACSFARGKHRIKKWGRTKILIELKKRNISEYCIKKAMKEIEEDYMETLERIMEKKWATIREKNIYKKKSKLASFLYGKGYESGIVWEMIKKNYPN